MINRRRFLLAAGLLLTSVSFGKTSTPTTQGLTLPILNGGETEVIGTLRVGHLAQGGRRVGLFRSGLFMGMLAREVRVQLFAPPAPEQWRELQQRLHLLFAARSYEIEGLKVSFSETSPAWLEARRLVSSGSISGQGLLLEGLVVLQEEGTLVRLAVTRLGLLPSSPKINHYLDKLTMTSTSRDLRQWSTQLGEDYQGKMVLPPGLSSQEAITLLRTEVLPTLQASLSNLAAVQDPAYQLHLTEAETLRQEITLALGDVRLLSSHLHMLEFLISTLNAHNFDVTLREIRDLTHDYFSLEEPFESHAKLLSISNKSLLASSKTALQNALNRYLEASVLIRSRPDQSDFPFQRDSGVLADEASLREKIPTWLAALNGPTKLDPQDSVSVNFAPYFAGAKSVRSLLPKWDDHGFRAGTLPDPTFGGILTGATTDRWRSF